MLVDPELDRTLRLGHGQLPDLTSDMRVVPELQGHAFALESKAGFVDARVEAGARCDHGDVRVVVADGLQRPVDDPARTFAF